MRNGGATVFFLGTGNAFNTDGRDSQCLWIEPQGSGPILVDAGPTALAAMARARVDPGALRAAFFTHLHGDHIAGWPFILLHSKYVARRTAPLAVLGPRGTRRRLRDLAMASYENIVVGNALGFRLDHTEIPVKSAIGRRGGRGLRYDVVPLDHHPTSIGYRFHVNGLKIAVSGDTRWCDPLEELGQGCDLLVLECTCLTKPDYAHVSLEEVREGIGRLGARRVALVHLTDEVEAALRRKPIRGVFAARDGMRVEV